MRPMFTYDVLNELLAHPLTVQFTYSSSSYRPRCSISALLMPCCLSLGRVLRNSQLPNTSFHCFAVNSNNSCIPGSGATPVDVGLETSSIFPLSTLAVLPSGVAAAALFLVRCILLILLLIVCLFYFCLWPRLCCPRPEQSIDVNIHQ